MVSHADPRESCPDLTMDEADGADPMIHPPELEKAVERIEGHLADITPLTHLTDDEAEELAADITLVLDALGAREGELEAAEEHIRILHREYRPFDRPAPSAPAEPGDERKYPCDRCGKLRTKAEGGTTFTVCDECWSIAYPKTPRAPFASGTAAEPHIEDIIAESDVLDTPIAAPQVEQTPTTDLWRERVRIINAALWDIRDWKPEANVVEVAEAVNVALVAWESKDAARSLAPSTGTTRGVTEKDVARAYALWIDGYNTRHWMDGLRRVLEDYAATGEKQ